jgi:ABC-type sugar transport system substrate-binding protein
MTAEFETMGEIVTVELTAPAPEEVALGDVRTIFIAQGTDSLAIGADDVPALIEALQAVVDA